MKKYSIYETKNSRGYSQRFINLNKEIVDTLQIKKGDTLYFIYQDNELLIKKDIDNHLKEILGFNKKEAIDFILNKYDELLKKETTKYLQKILDFKKIEVLDFIFNQEGIIVKKSKVIGDMQIGKRYHKLTIPSYICDKLHITSENSFTYDLLEDCVRINIEV